MHIECQCLTLDVFALREDFERKGEVLAVCQHFPLFSLGF